MEIGLDMISGSATAKEGKEAAKRSKDLSKAFDEKIRAFLGEEDYAVYKEFEDTQHERMQVNLFKKSLTADDQLSEDQEHDLIVAMHEERTGFSFSTGLDQQDTFDPSVFTEEAMARHMDEMTQVQEKYIARARDLLSEAQMNQFLNSLEQQRVMQEAAMKMAIQMFSTSSGNNGQTQTHD